MEEAMSKEIIAYCGFDPDHREAYIKWSRAYLGLTDSQKLEFLTQVINELVHEHQFVMRIISNLKTSSAGQGLPQ